MALSKDVQQTYNRFGLYIDKIRAILLKNGIDGFNWSSCSGFGKLVMTDAAARSEIKELLKAVASQDGGKGGLATLGLVVALSIGGVGIAAMGSAFGVPAILLGLLGSACGALLGNELDGTGVTAKAMAMAGIVPDSQLFFNSYSNRGYVLQESVGSKKHRQPSVFAAKEAAKVDALPEMASPNDHGDSQALIQVKTELQELKELCQRMYGISSSNNERLQSLQSALSNLEAQQKLQRDRTSADLIAIGRQISAIHVLTEKNRAQLATVQERVNVLGNNIANVGIKTQASFEAILVQNAKIFRTLLAISVILLFSVVGGALVVGHLWH